MLLNCLNRRVYLSTLRSLNQPGSTKSLLHTSRTVFDDDGGGSAKNEKESKGPDSKDERLKRKQIQKAKFTKMEFISLDEKKLKEEKQPAIQRKLKPAIDFESVIKPKPKSDYEKIDDVKASKIQFEKTKKINERLQKYPPTRIENESANINKLVNFIDDDKRIEELEIKLLIKPNKKISEKTKQEEALKAVAEEPNTLSNLLKKVKTQKKEKRDNEKSEESKQIETLLTEENFQFKKPLQQKFGESSYLLFHKLDSGNGLSIFTQSNSSMSKSTQESPIWSLHSEEELRTSQEIPYMNGFDELIKLTDEGKLWKFPIDNEQGLDELDDYRTPFYEHVFLEQHLERFPDVEPVQQFMALAINGLSQNGYISVKEKLEIIDWYRDFFTQKLDLVNQALEAERKENEIRNSIRKS